MTHHVTNDHLDTYFEGYRDFVNDVRDGKKTEADLVRQIEIRFDMVPKGSKLVAKDLLTYGKIPDMVERDIVKKAIEDGTVFDIGSISRTKSVVTGKGTIRPYNSKTVSILKRGAKDTHVTFFRNNNGQFVSHT